MDKSVLSTHADLRVIAEHIESLIGTTADNLVVSLKDGRSGRSINDRADLVLLESQLASVQRLIAHFETVIDNEDEAEQH